MGIILTKVIYRRKQSTLRVIQQARISTQKSRQQQAEQTTKIIREVRSMKY